MTEQLHFHFSLSCTGEGNGSPLQCSCLENPGDGGAWWAAVYGVAQNRTRLKRLSSSSSIDIFKSGEYVIKILNFPIKIMIFYTAGIPYMGYRSISRVRLQQTLELQACLFQEEKLHVANNCTILSNYICCKLKIHVRM